MKNPWIIPFALVGGFLILGIIGYIYIKVFIPGATITSWWRTPLHNQEVGGQPYSLHLIGLGFDVLPVNQQTQTRLASLFTKVINEGDHLHAQFL